MRPATGTNFPEHAGGERLLRHQHPRHGAVTAVLDHPPDPRPRQPLQRAVVGARAIGAGLFPHVRHAGESALLQRLVSSGIRNGRLASRIWVHHLGHAGPLTLDRGRQFADERHGAAAARVTAGSDKLL